MLHDLNTLRNNLKHYEVKHCWNQAKSIPALNCSKLNRIIWYYPTLITVCDCRWKFENISYLNCIVIAILSSNHLQSCIPPSSSSSVRREECFKSCNNSYNNGPSNLTLNWTLFRSTTIKWSVQICMKENVWEPGNQQLKSLLISINKDSLVVEITISPSSPLSLWLSHLMCWRLTVPAPPQWCSGCHPWWSDISPDCVLNSGKCYLKH